MTRVMMKKIMFYVVFLTAMLFQQSCSKDVEGVVSGFNDDDNREIHFVQNSIIKSFDQGTLDGEFTVTLGRLGNKGSYKVRIDIDGKDASLFSFEPTVTIPDGQYAVEFPVYVDMSRVVLGSEVSATLNISGRDAELGDNPAYISQYSDFLKLSASFRLEWEPYMRLTESGETVQQTATYLYNQFYQGAQGGMLVERAKGSENVFRLLDWAAGVGFVFMINKDNSVTVPAQSIGYYYEDVREYVYVADVAQYLGDDSYYQSYPCTFDGKQTFMLNLVYYVSDGIFAVGPEAFIFAGDHDDDPFVTAEYLGGGRFGFTFGSHTSECRAIVVPGDITKDESSFKSAVNSICKGSADDIRVFGEGEQIWTPESANNTLVAVPFNAEGVPGEAICIRFTYDPEGVYIPQISACELKAFEKSPRSTLELFLKLKNATSARYVMLPKDVMDYYIDYYGETMILDQIGSSLDGGQLDEAASEAGLRLFWQGLEEGAEYGVLLRVSNSFGDTETRVVYGRLEAASDEFVAKSLEDFTGSYLASALVTTSNDSQGHDESFRVDVISLGDGKVGIKGLCNYRNYSPQITGIYDPERHTIRLNSQNLGEFSYMDVVFGFVGNLYSGIWGQESALEFGFGDDGYVHWCSAPDSAIDVTGYTFLLFDGTSYSGYNVGDKSYTQLLMKKL